MRQGLGGQAGGAAYRNRGLATRMVRELIQIAHDSGLDKLEIEFIPRREMNQLRQDPYRT